MTNMTRRTVVRGTAWTVPVVAVAATAPAFAASQRCRPYAECKKPGESTDSTKTYIVASNCGAADQAVTVVTVDGKETTPLGGGRFETVEFKDSRNFRDIRVTFSDGTSEEYLNVPFPPCSADK